MSVENNYAHFLNQCFYCFYNYYEDRVQNAFCLFCVIEKKGQTMSKKKEKITYGMKLMYMIDGTIMVLTGTSKFLERIKHAADNYASLLIEKESVDQVDAFIYSIDEKQTKTYLEHLTYKR